MSYRVSERKQHQYRSSISIGIETNSSLAYSVSTAVTRDLGLLYERDWTSSFLGPRCQYSWYFQFSRHTGTGKKEFTAL